MNDAFDPDVLGVDERFAVGQPVPRSEDPVLLKSEGHYADNVSLPGQTYAVMVRSDVALACSMGSTSPLPGRAIRFLLTGREKTAATAGKAASAAARR